MCVPIPSQLSEKICIVRAFKGKVIVSFDICKNTKSKCTYSIGQDDIHKYTQL